MSLDFSLECTCCETTLFTANITHNLNKMADACGLYEVLWHASNVIDGKPVQPKAEDVIAEIEKGLKELKSDPEKYKKLNPENDWGRYETLVKFTEEVLDACKKYPKAVVWCCT